MGAGNVLGVTCETPIQDGRGRHQREGVWNGGLAASRLHVTLTGTMTSLATRPLRWFLTGGHALIVRVLVKADRDVRMARFANVAADITAGYRVQRGGGRPVLRQHHHKDNKEKTK